MDRTFTRYSGSEIVDQGQYDVTWQQVRKERDALLVQTNWRARKDVVLPNAWKEYRQALRDITEPPDANTAADHWPEAPSDE